MDREFDPALLLPQAVRDFPRDLLAIVLLAIGTDIVVLAPGSTLSLPRAILALVYVLFLPGYAFISALFPRRGPCLLEQTDDDSFALLERFALSVAMSVVLVTFVGFLVVLSPFLLSVPPLLVGLTVLTIGTGIIAHIRRRQLSSAERFRISTDWLWTRATGKFTDEWNRDTLLNVILVLSVLFMVSSVAYALTVPKPSDKHTEFYLLTEQEDGSLVADDFPSSFRPSESKPVIIGVHNEEYKSVSYTVIVQEQRIIRTNDTVRVVERNQMARHTTQLSHNQTETIRQELSPTLTGENLRLQFLLYIDDPPSTPTAANAYRSTHLFVNVTRP
jgi:uncharacterized membrane protein